MTSQINPNDIDGAYPVAGQDNNSQGFRDNFTNTKTNFQYAYNEITALQTNGVFTNVDNNMNNNDITAVNLNDVSTNRTQISATTGSIAINYASSQYQTIGATTGPISLSFTNFPASAYYGSVRVRITISNPSYYVTLPSAVSVNAVGIQGYDSGTNRITFAAAGVYEFDFGSSDNGSTITITEANKQIQPLNNSSEDLAPSTGANLALTTSYFTTAAAETATLAAGTAGQIKVFSAVDVTAGNMVITVTNAGWKSSGTGTITFGSRGVGCTLQYTNSKWYCIGNNGCTFG
jgi:hypothetical protein